MNHGVEQFPTEEIVRNAAISIGAFEAIAFAVDGVGSRLVLRPLVHIRPGLSGQTERARAILAFERLMIESARTGRDEAVPYMVAGDSEVSRYCLTHTMCTEGSPERRIAAGFIVKCESEFVAGEKLAILQRIL